MLSTNPISLGNSILLSLKKILVVEKRGARGGGGVDWGTGVG